MSLIDQLANCKHCSRNTFRFSSCFVFIVLFICIFQLDMFCWLFFLKTETGSASGPQFLRLAK